MGKIEFPQQVTTENIPHLIELGHEIEDMKPWWAKRDLTLKARMASAFFSFVILVSAGLGIASLIVGWLLILGYVGWFDLIPNPYILLLMSGVFAWLVSTALFLLVRDKVLPRFYPPPNQLVFSVLAKIAECLLEKKRKKAGEALYELSRVWRKYFRQNRELELSLENEMGKLDTIAFDRLVLFSNDRKIPTLFLRLGLACAKEDEPMIYSSVVSICKKIDRFNGDIGKSRGVWFFLEKNAKSITALVYVVLLLVNVILTILYVLRVIPLPPASPLPSG